MSSVRCTLTLRLIRYVCYSFARTTLSAYRPQTGEYSTCRQFISDNRICTSKQGWSRICGQKGDIPTNTPYFALLSAMVLNENGY